jgi:hypothetical protein
LIINLNSIQYIVSLNSYHFNKKYHYNHNYVFDYFITMTTTIPSIFEDFESWSNWLVSELISRLQLDSSLLFSNNNLFLPTIDPVLLQGFNPSIEPFSVSNFIINFNL